MCRPLFKALRVPLISMVIIVITFCMGCESEDNNIKITSETKDTIVAEINTSDYLIGEKIRLDCDTWRLAKKYPNITSMTVIQIDAIEDKYGNKSQSPVTKYVYDAATLTEMRKFVDGDAYSNSKNKGGDVFKYEDGKWVDLFDSQLFKDYKDKIKP